MSRVRLKGLIEGMVFILLKCCRMLEVQLVCGYQFICVSVVYFVRCCVCLVCMLVMKVCMVEEWIWLCWVIRLQGGRCGFSWIGRIVSRCLFGQFLIIECGVMLIMLVCCSRESRVMIEVVLMILFGRLMCVLWKVWLMILCIGLGCCCNIQVSFCNLFQFSLCVCDNGFCVLIIMQSFFLLRLLNIRLLVCVLLGMCLSIMFSWFCCRVWISMLLVFIWMFIDSCG